MEWLRHGFMGHHVLVTLYVLAVAPSVYALELAAKSQWTECVVVGLAWLFLFPVAARWFHRHRLVHIGVSMTAMAAVAIALPLVVETA
jgi:hypothetical protein